MNYIPILFLFHSVSIDLSPPIQVTPSAQFDEAENEDEDVEDDANATFDEAENEDEDFKDDDAATFDEAEEEDEEK